MRALLWLLLVPAIAHADPDTKTRADEIYKQGEAQFAAKDYLTAAMSFETSYALEPDPAVLFNIAQAYRLGRACAQAARYYHQFVAAVPSPPERDKLEHYIADMDACAKAEASATKPRIVHDTKVVHDTHVVHASAPVTLPITLGAVGVVALGIGVAYTIDLHHITRDRDALCTSCVWGTVADRSAHLDQRGQRAEIGEAVSYVAGGVAVIAGAVLFALSRGEARDHVIVAPTSGGATVGATFRF